MEETSSGQPDKQNPASETEKNATKKSKGRPGLLHRICHQVLLAGATLCTILAILILTASWWLASGPVSLEMVRPDIEQMLSRKDGSAWISIEKAFLEWDPDNHTLALRAQGVRAIGGTRLLAEVPELFIGISARAMVFGEFAPTHIEFIQPVLSLTRNQDGDFELDLGQGAETSLSASGAPEVSLPQKIRDILEPAEQEEGIFSRLSLIRLRDATLLFNDALMEEHWEGKLQELALRKTAEGLEANAGFSLDIGDESFGLDALALYNAARGEISVSLALPRLRPAWLSRIMPGIEEISLVDVPLSGRGDLVLTEEGAIQAIRFRVDAAPGRIGHPDLAWPVILASMRVDGTFQPEQPVSFQDFRPDPLDWRVNVRTGLQIPTDGKPLTLDIAASRQAGEELSQVDLSIDAADPRAVTDRIREIASVFVDTSLFPEATDQFLDGIDIPLGLTVSGALHMDGRPEYLQFTLTGGEGTVTVPDLLQGPLALKGFTLDGQVSGNGERISINPLVIDLPQGQLIAIASPNGPKQDGVLPVAAQFFARDIPLSGLMAIWPILETDKSRIWVAENLSDGEITSAMAGLRMRVGGEAGPEIDSLDYQFRLKGSSAIYLKGLPPLENIRATARGDLEGIDFGIFHAEHDSIVIPDALIRISGFSRDMQEIDIDAHLTAPVRNVMRLLNRPRLGYPGRVGIDPEKTAGSTVSRLKFAFPLDKDLTFDAVNMDISNDVTGLKVADAALGADATDGKASIHIDNQLLTLKGNAKFAGSPVTITWRENLKSSSGKHDFRTDMKVSGRFGTESLEKLGFDFALPWVEGPFDADVVLNTPLKGRTAIDVSLGLDAARLHIDPLGWEKPSGTPGKGTLRVELDNGVAHDISSFSLLAAGLSLNGSAEFDPEGTDIERVRLGRVRLGKTDVTNLGIILGQSHFGFYGGDGVLDLGPFLSDDEESGATKPADQNSGGLMTGVDLEPELPFSLSTDITLDRLLLEDGAEIRKLSLKLDHDSKQWNRISFKAGTKPENTVNLDFQRRRKPWELLVYGRDVGGFLKGTGALPHLYQGELALSASFDYANSNRPLEGRLELRDYTIIGAPTLARVLKTASLIGILDLLSGDGISFSKMESRFTWVRNHLILHNARTHSSAVGITMKGWMNLEENRVEMAGTVAPAYLLSQVVGSIPLLGDLLTGGEGEGVFAATYRLSGDLEDPSVSVNPLTALAPGFLRSLFSGEEIADPIPEGAAIPGGNVAAPPIQLHDSLNKAPETQNR